MPPSFITPFGGGWVEINPIIYAGKQWRINERKFLPAKRNQPIG
jgi:hypothetical protein